MDTKDFIKTHKDYPKDFIASVPDVLLVGVGGSYAYGTNTETSDLDIRGFYRNPLEELIGSKKDSEQKVAPNSDAILYSFKKIITLLSNCNPNVIEILGLKPEHYLVITDEAKLILKQKEIFLSKKAIYTFGRYALSQLNRLVNKSGRAKSEEVQNEYRSLNKAMIDMEARYHKDKINVLFSVKENAIHLDFHAKDIPMDQLCIIINELNCIHKDYAKSRRNDRAIKHDKLNKHMMHLLRLYIMGIDILERHEIITYREKEHNLLMDIRNNKYLKEDNCTPTEEFMEILNDYTKKFDEAAKNTTLPDEPDYKKINELAIKINTMRNW